MACNGRNGAPGAVYHHRNKILDLYGRDVEVDFRGEEVTVQNLIRLLTGRQDKGKSKRYVLLFMCLCLDTPRSRRLNTDSKSNILFYLTGHGGENFLKFQDDEEINAFELADAFEQMNQKKRYNELLFIGLETIFYSFEYFNFSRYMPGSVNYQISLLGRICWFCQFKSWRRFVIASC